MLKKCVVVRPYSLPVLFLMLFSFSVLSISAAFAADPPDYQLKQVENWGIKSNVTGMHLVKEPGTDVIKKAYLLTNAGDGAQNASIKVLVYNKEDKKFEISSTLSTGDINDSGWEDGPRYYVQADFDRDEYNTIDLVTINSRSNNKTDVSLLTAESDINSPNYGELKAGVVSKGFPDIDVRRAFALEANGDDYPDIAMYGFTLNHTNHEYKYYLAIMLNMKNGEFLPAYVTQVPKLRDITSADLGNTGSNNDLLLTMTSKDQKSYLLAITDITGANAKIHDPMELSSWPGRLVYANMDDTPEKELLITSLSKSEYY